MNYQVGDMILYGTQGVCRIAEIAERDFSGNSMLYYILKPVFDERSTLYVPVYGEAADKLRRILSVPEVYKLIKAMPDEDTIWIENEAVRRKKHKEIISQGDRQELDKLIKTIYLHDKKQKAIGKKLHVADERFMKDAEKILYDEFAYVLNIEPDQVVTFITEEIFVPEKQKNG